MFLSLGLGWFCLSKLYISGLRTEFCSSALYMGLGCPIGCCFSDYGCSTPSRHETHVRMIAVYYQKLLLNEFYAFFAEMSLPALPKSKKKSGSPGMC